MDQIENHMVRESYHPVFDEACRKENLEWKTNEISLVMEAVEKFFSVAKVFKDLKTTEANAFYNYLCEVLLGDETELQILKTKLD